MSDDDSITISRQEYADLLRKSLRQTPAQSGTSPAATPAEPDNPFGLPPGAFAALPRAERDRLWSNYLAKNGQGDPFHRFKKGR